jgi:glyoxylase-like metal-dependent hydrolase (beta-lactamase superfamily II)
MKPTHEELFPGVYLLKSSVGGRPLTLPLLAGTERTVLLDTGCASDPAEVILPTLQALKIGPEKLSCVITSHSDFDHRGGNQAIKAWAPRSLLCCGDADREWIEEPARLYRNRYDCYRDEHGIFYPPEVESWILNAAGLPQPVDLTLQGGEKIRLSPDWEIEIVALPGHSAGHLGLWDRKNKALYAADAIHGAVYETFEGNAALPPTYATIRPYLQTIRFIEALDLDCYVGCHWPIKRGREIAAFCDESRRFVLRTETLMLELLEKPRTLRELCDLLGPKLGEWPRETDQDLVYALSGHLTDLLERQRIKKLPPASGKKWPLYVLSCGRR